MNLFEELLNLTRLILLNPPRENGKSVQIASPDDILNENCFGTVKKINFPAIPLGNHGHENRRRDHSYRGHESLNETVF